MFTLRSKRPRSTWIAGILACLTAGLLSVSTSSAAENEDGYLLVHATRDLVSSFSGTDIRDCAEVVINLESNDETPVMIWVLASFPSYTSPSVRAVEFGIDYAGFSMEGHRMADGFSVEVPTSDWPGAFSGTSFQINKPIERDIFDVYWFFGFAYEGASFEVTDHPNGAAQFANGDIPPKIDEVEEFGKVGFGVVGANPCLADQPQGACCLINGACIITYEAVCDVQQASYMGDDEDCFPGICDGGCCINSLCYVYDIVGCEDEGGEFLGAGRGCHSGRSCIREETTWGKLKYTYSEDF